MAKRLPQHDAYRRNRQGECAQCGLRRVLEPHSFVHINGGALLMDRTRRSGWPDERMDGFLHLTWHGAHDGGRGVNRDVYVVSPIVEDERGGQFEFYFCSIRCLRRFLNDAIDRLVAQVKLTRSRLAKGRGGRANKAK